MIKRLLLIVTLGVTLSGCFMAPLALYGPATAGFSQASLMQSGITTLANHIVKKNTGKSIGEHAFDSFGDNAYDSIYEGILKQSYFPEKKSLTKINKSQN